MTYQIPCNQPDFAQSVPAGTWTRIEGDSRSGQYRYRNDDTGATVIVPAIWYNGTALERAAYLLFCAERAEENAKRIGAEGRAWSKSDADRHRQQAADLRDQARIYAAAGKAIAGHVEAF